METAPSAHHERGTALIWALLFVMITSGMIISHTLFLASHRRESEVRYGNEALAANFSRSGLVEALGWFHKQDSQPVTTFSPILDPNATPPLFDTIDPAIGLVREFEINGSLWGRYEVRTNDARDISTERGYTTQGSAWELVLRSFIFRRNDGSLGFDESPNRVESMTAMKTEIRGLPIRLPVLAALNVDDPANVTLGDDSLVVGGDRPAVAYQAAAPSGGGGLPPATGPLAVVAPTTTSPDLTPYIDRLVGTPRDTGASTFDSSPRQVFGMSLSDLQSFSDVVLQTDTGRADPVVGSNQVITTRGSLTEAVGLLVDNGLLVINGNLVLLPGSVSNIDGVVFVAGNATVDGELKVNGSMIVRGSFTSSDGVPVRINLDTRVLERLTQRLSRYRLPRSFKPAN